MRTCMTTSSVFQSREEDETSKIAPGRRVLIETLVEGGVRAHDLPPRGSRGARRTQLLRSSSSRFSAGHTHLSFQKRKV